MTTPKRTRQTTAVTAIANCSDGEHASAEKLTTLDGVKARLEQLKQENQRLKLLVAELSLRNEALKRVMAKKY
jgi:beta-phosphoglucomutase-like phosphatase (HAD superfamily)